MPMKELVDGNPVLRKKVYAAYAVVGTVLGAVEVAFLALPEDSPTWLRVSMAVYLFLGTAFGFGARSKVEATPVDVNRVQAAEIVVPEDGAGEHRGEWNGA